MLNKVKRARLRATEKRLAHLDDTLNRFQLDSLKLSALLRSGHIYSIGMSAFRYAVNDCIVEDFAEVEA